MTVDSLPCGVCDCYVRTGYVVCSGNTAQMVEGHFRTLKIFAWARALDLRNILGVVDMEFYKQRKFPGLIEMDVTGISYLNKFQQIYSGNFQI